MKNIVFAWMTWKIEKNECTQSVPLLYPTSHSSGNHFFAIFCSKKDFPSNRRAVQKYHLYLICTPILSKRKHKFRDILFTVIYKGNRHFASPLDHFGGPKLFPGGPKSLENLRNRVFASSRYDLNKILSKNIKFRESYSLLEKGDLR